MFGQHWFRLLSTKRHKTLFCSIICYDLLAGAIYQALKIMVILPLGELFLYTPPSETITGESMVKVATIKYCH